MSSYSKKPDFRDIPPAETIKPVDAPPLTKGSTSAQLKADIDSGRTGDKNEAFDPALSPLGTDDEAAGHSPSKEQVDLARRQEGIDRWKNANDKDRSAHPPANSQTALYGFVGFIGFVLVLFIGAFTMF